MSFIISDDIGILPASMDNGELKVYFPDGSALTFAIPIYRHVEKQYIQFFDDNILFLLQDDTYLYIGYKVGQISIIRKSDNLIIGTIAHKINIPDFVQIGYYIVSNKKSLNAYLCLSDKKTIISSDARHVCHLDAPCNLYSIPGDLVKNMLRLSDADVKAFYVYSYGKGVIINENDNSLLSSVTRFTCYGDKIY